MFRRRTSSRLRPAASAPPAGHAYAVRILFSSTVASQVTGRSWFAGQILHTHPDGRVELQFMTHRLDGLDRWILGWADDAIVLQPTELRSAVHSTLRSILASC